MAKKRKAPRQRAGGPSPADEKADANLAFNSWEDIADSEDEYLLNRDKILLDEGPEAKRRRKQEEQETALELSDEEVLQLPESESDEEDYAVRPTLKTGVHPSDTDDREPGHKDEKEDDEYVGWDKDEYYGGDIIEDEEAAEEEEKEARRLQQKYFAKMSEVDFGLDEWEGDAQDDRADDYKIGSVAEAIPETHITAETSFEERLRLLHSRYPEFEPIATEFLELQALYQKHELLAIKAKELMSIESNATTIFGKKHPAIIRWQAMSAHLGSLAMYFTVLTSTATPEGTALAKPPQELRDHPIVETLLATRQLWQRANSIVVPDIEEHIASTKKRMLEQRQLGPRTEAPPVVSSYDPKEVETPRPKISIVDNATMAVQAEANERRAERKRKLEEDLASLDALTAASRAKAKKRRTVKTARPQDDCDLGDEIEMTAKEIAEKVKRRKTLGFYTSQIAQKASKRDVAGRDAGGDTDIPHRERWRDRQIRFAAAAEKRTQQIRQNSKDNDESGKEDIKGQTVRLRVDAGPGPGSDSEDYYDMIDSRAKQRKADKKALAAAYKQAEAEGGKVVEEQTVGADGKRKITYAIEKNKGLTQSKKKSVRNPRVKQKQKFEKKTKKLASQKAIYKGGEGKGGYGGELSGIKTHLVKSVKL